MWIDYFQGTASQQTDRLDAAPGVDEVPTGDRILIEVLQGFRDDRQYRAAREGLASLTVLDSLGTDTALRSAQACRTLRRQGITIRTTVDVVIACCCIDAGPPLLFSDRDFQPLVDHLGLSAARGQ